MRAMTGIGGGMKPPPSLSETNRALVIAGSAGIAGGAFCGTAQRGVARLCRGWHRDSPTKKLGPLEIGAASFGHQSVKQGDRCGWQYRRWSPVTWFET